MGYVATLQSDLRTYLIIYWGFNDYSAAIYSVIIADSVLLYYTGGVGMYPILLFVKAYVVSHTSLP